MFYCNTLCFNNSGDLVGKNFTPVCNKNLHPLVFVRDEHSMIRTVNKSIILQLKDNSLGFNSEKFNLITPDTIIELGHPVGLIHLSRQLIKSPRNILEPPRHEFAVSGNHHGFRHFPISFLQTTPSAAGGYPTRAPRGISTQ